MNIYQSIHEQALRSARQYKKSQHELLCAIQQVDAKRIFLKYGYKNLFEYCIKALQLSEGTTYAIIRVARKSLEIPEIQTALAQGTLSLSHAKSVVSVITLENKTEWMQKAQTLSVRELEREVAKESPSTTVIEKMKVIGGNMIKLEYAVDLDTERMIRRVQDLLSQRKKRAANLEETMKEVFEVYLAAKDPMSKKSRVRNIGKFEKQSTGTNHSQTEPGSASRTRTIPSSLKLQILKRDGGVCQANDPVGNSCGQGRWLDIHHVKPLSQGGKNEASNLITLCKDHHRLWHMNLTR